MERFVQRTSGGRHPLVQIVMVDRDSETVLVDLKGQRWLRVIGELRERCAPRALPAYSDIARGFELPHALGMRLALGMTAAAAAVRCPWAEWAGRERFLRRLEQLPDEVILYWFTGCFYGLKQAAVRAAFLALLTTPAQDD